MSEALGQEEFNLPAVAEESSLSQIPLHIQWLQATDPRIFTPHSWANNQDTRIDFASPDGQGLVRVERYIRHYLDGAIGLDDELHEPHDYSNVSGIRYEFSDLGAIVKFHVKLGDHLERMLGIVTNLVQNDGATIRATTGFTTKESYFKSDGQQWVDMGISLPTAPPRQIKLDIPSAGTITLKNLDIDK